MGYGGGGFYGGGGYGGGFYGGGGYGGGFYGGGGGYGGGGVYGGGGSGYAPGVDTADLQQAGFQVAADDQSATNGGLTIINQDTGSSDLTTIPGVSTNADETQGANIVNGADPSLTRTTTETDPVLNEMTTTTVAPSRDSTISQVDANTYQVTNGTLAIQTQSGGTTSFINERITGNAFATVTQSTPGGPITVKFGSAGL